MTPTSDAPPTASEHAARPLPEKIGRYQIVERIGAGGMGTVYKAHDPHLNRTVAVKLPIIDMPAQDRVMRLERFQREARSAAQVWHPHVCPIYDVGEDQGQPFVVMAYVEGQSLAERLAQHGRFEDVAAAVVLVRQVLDALEAVHGHGIVHRDLKPGNIMLDAAGRAVLTDFGLARPEYEAAHLTSDGAIVGTPAYMAPEQAAGQSARIGPWTDLYSVGVVFFQMLTGRLPFEGPALAVLAKILHDPPPPLGSLRPYLDPGLETILLKALGKEPEGRFRSARQFSDALGALATTTSTTAMPQALGTSITAMPQALGSHEELRQQVSRLNATDSSKYMSALQRGFPYLLAAGFFTIAGACSILMLTSDNYRGILSPWIGWLVFLGSLSILFGVVRRWVRQQDLIGKNKKGETWLMTAARQGHASFVKDLLARGADVHEKDNIGQTALMKAAGNGHLAVVRLLLAGGTEVNERDNEGQTALMKAMAAGHPDIVSLLEAAGAKE
jgi:serine/threonine protein kinase